MPNSGAFRKGDGRPRKPKGAVSKLTKSAREAYQLAFEGAGGIQAFIVWAQANRTEFYKLHARLIPVEHVGAGGDGPISTVVKHIYESGESAKSGA